MDEQEVYTFEESFNASLNYFNGDDLSAGVWVNKYAIKDNFGRIYEKSPEEMHWRIANEIARIEKKYKNPMSAREVFDLLDHFRYVIPSGSSMFGIGNKFQAVSLSDCFVIGSDNDTDSYGAIMRIDEEQVQLMKRRGGVGHDLSYIRPKGLPVNNSALTSTGLVPFMERYSNSTCEVAQNGCHGRLMLSVSIQHPEAETFIDAKINEGKAANANVSVKITDGFMEAVMNDKDFVQQYPVDSVQPAFKKEISAKQLWERIVHTACKSTETGILFWDTVAKESLPDCYADLGFGTVSTNSYGEVPLCSYDSCRLLSVNLYSYVKYPFTKEAAFDFDLFEKHVVMAQRIMDDIVDLEMEKIDIIMEKVKNDPQSDDVKSVEYRLWEKIKDKSAKSRRTGIGVTAEADMIAAMGLSYGTEEAVQFSQEVHKKLAISAYRSSVTLAKERGAFSVFDAEREVENPFLLRIKDAAPDLYEDMMKYGRRNMACLTIAPSETTSLLTQTTPGIEPVFMPVSVQRRKVNPNDTDVRVDFVDETGDSFEEYIVYHKKFIEWMKINGLDTEKHYTREELDVFVKSSPYHKAAADDLDCLMKIKMQGAIQKWVDHSVSTIVHLPNNVDDALINKLYVEAWRAGCKICTIYRNGTHSRELNSISKKDVKQSTEAVQDNEKDLVSSEEKREHIYYSPNVVEIRPQVLDCDVVRFQNNKDKWVAFVGLLNGYPYEIFTGLQDDDEGIVLPKSVTKGKIIKQTNSDGSHRYDFQFENKRGYKTTVEGLSEKFNPEYWNYAKLISGVLRYRMPIDHVIHLVGSLQLKSESINTWTVGVERALKKYVTDGTKASGQVCPICGQETMIYQDGCLTCTNCGSSRCR